jgi:hypothetical protein
MLNVSTGGVTRSLREKAFFKEYMEKIHVAIATPAYHFIHLLPPHPPFLTLPNGRYGGRVLPETRENYVNEARSITRLFVDFLRSLRDIGVYDSALIIVHGDHGFSFDPIVSGNALDLCLQRMPALMLVKPPGSAGPLDISDVQSSLTDIPATVLDTLGVDHDLPGKSVFDLMPGETRKRQLVVLPEGNLGNGLRRFELAGDVFDPAACTELERGMIDDTGSVFSPGREFGFGLLGQVNPYQQTGWATAGSTSTWTMGNQATLSMPVPAVTQDLNWSAEARGFIVPGKVTQQRVEIIANGLSVSNTLLQSSNLHRLSALIPAELLRSGRLDLVFRLPDATSRQEAGIQIDDKRRLAIEFMSMRMDEIPPIRTGEAFPVGRRQSGLKYLTTGWGRSGDGYISIGSTARIRLPVVPTEFAGTLSLTLRAYIKPPVVAQQRLVGMINGTEVTTWSTDSGRVQVVELPISAAEMQTGRLDIELGLPDAVCPACVGTGGDERRRAIELLQFELQEAH